MRKLPTRKTILAVYVAVFLFISLAIVVSVNVQQRQIALDEASEKSRILLDHNLSIHTYFTKQLKPSFFEALGKKADPEYFDPVWMSSTYAVREIDKYYRVLSPSGYYYKESAVNARTRDNEADVFEKTFIEKLKKNPDLVTESFTRNIDGRPYFVVMRRGESMEQSCLRCHTKPDYAPYGLVRRYGGMRSFNRTEGELVSAISIRIPLQEAFKAADMLSLELSIFLLLILGVTVITQFVAIDKLILRPITAVGNRVNQIINDDTKLGEKIDVKSNSREVTDFIDAFNRLSMNLKAEKEGLVEQVESRTHELSLKVDELEKALAMVKRLQGIIPICGYCKKIRNDKEVWQQLEDYITENSDALLSHGLCPECYEKQILEYKLSTAAKNNEDGENKQIDT